MKINKYFTLACAALAFTACSNDDDISKNNPDDKVLGELVDAISINFTNGDGPSTRVMSGETKSEGSEAQIIKAYVFAKEANPEHTRPLEGDWTVKEVLPGIGDTEVKGDGIVDDGKTRTVKNIATFKGVRQGENIYVIANDPTLTLAIAEGLAHKGTNSEATIKDYIANLSKDYLAGLSYRPEKLDANSKKEVPTGEFIMAGMATIPVSPNIPSGGTVTVNVPLDRELAKVNFKAGITTDTKAAAYNNVEFQKGDGIAVVRVARKTSMFNNNRESDFYVATSGIKEDWPITDHSLVKGVYASFCDQTPEGSLLFDGTANAADAAANKWNGKELVDFNKTVTAADAGEYRFVWTLKDLDKDPSKSDLFGNSQAINAPVFYVTPNYENNTNGVTVICTQATYVGETVLTSDSLVKYMDIVLAADPTKLFVAVEAGDNGGTALSIYNPIGTQSVLDDIKVVKKHLGLGATAGKDATEQLASLTAAITAAKAKAGFAAADGAVLDKYNTVVAYDNLMDKLYLATLLSYRFDKANQNPFMATGTGSYPAPNTSSIAFSDSILTYAHGAKVATDTLLAGPKGLIYAEKKVGANNYVMTVKKKDGTTIELSDPTDDGKIMPLYSPGKPSRKAYFSQIKNEDIYARYKGMKLYYRADVADYTGGVSNKITERNTYYQSIGTITSFGSRTIHDAINSDDNTMKVDVTVNKWRLSVNEIPM